MEWNDETRGRALRLTEYEDDLCRCGCGLPMSLAHDPKQPFVVDKFICYAGRAKAKVERQQRDEHKTAAEGWDDGEHSFVRKPTEEELRKQPRAGQER